MGTIDLVYDEPLETAMKTGMDLDAYEALTYDDTLAQNQRYEDEAADEVALDALYGEYEDEAAEEVALDALYGEYADEAAEEVAFEERVQDRLAARKKADAAKAEREREAEERDAKKELDRQTAKKAKK